MANQNTPKYVDILEEDKPIAGQKFVCVSFVSPEKILKLEYFLIHKTTMAEKKYSGALNLLLMNQTHHHLYQYHLSPRLH